MASGVDIQHKPKHVQQAILSAQLDNDLIEYYKLLTVTHAISQHFDKATDCLQKLAAVLLPEMQDASGNKQAVIDSLLAGMDKWVLKIDKDSLPKPTKGLIERKEPVKPTMTPSQRRRVLANSNK
jgi:hypothetical protein